MIIQVEFFKARPIKEITPFLFYMVKTITFHTTIFPYYTEDLTKRKYVHIDEFEFRASDIKEIRIIP